MAHQTAPDGYKRWLLPRIVFSGAGGDRAGRPEHDPRGDVDRLDVDTDGDRHGVAATDDPADAIGGPLVPDRGDPIADGGVTVPSAVPTATATDAVSAV